MIAIINISPELNPFGMQRYSLRINNTEICQFTHKQEDGLAACLIAAAKAVEKKKWNEIKNLLSPDIP